MAANESPKSDSVNRTSVIFRILGTANILLTSTQVNLANVVPLLLFLNDFEIRLVGNYKLNKTDLLADRIT